MGRKCSLANVVKALFIDPDGNGHAWVFINLHAQAPSSFIGSFVDFKYKYFSDLFSEKFQNKF